MSAEELTRALDHLEDEIGRLQEPAHEAAERLAAATRVESPFDTGLLRASINAVGSEVEITAPYAGFVNRDNPFRQRAIDRVDWAEPFRDHIDRALHDAAGHY